jgi:FMN reductase
METHMTTPATTPQGASAPRRLVVIAAGLSQPSATRLLADRLAAASTNALAAKGVPVEVEVVELRDHARDLANATLTGFATGTLQHALDAVARADAVIAVTPVFSASYTGLFKMFFDVLDPDALRGVPVLIGATAGTARHSLVLDYAMRPLFTYLHAVVVPTGVFAATDDWGAVDDASGVRPGLPVADTLADRIDRAAGELADIVAARPPRTAVDHFADVPTFDALFAGGNST